MNSNVLSGSVCIILISLKLTLCNLFCKQVLLQPDTSAELQMTGYGGAGRTRSRGPSMQQQLCGARQGEVGVSCLTVPNCGLSCSLQSSLQLHMRRSTSVTALGGRAGSPAQQLSWNTILASVDVNVPVMLETPQRYSFQEQVHPLYTVV